MKHFHRTLMLALFALVVSVGQARAEATLELSGPVEALCFVRHLPVQAAPQPAENPLLALLPHLDALTSHASVEAVD